MKNEILQWLTSGCLPVQGLELLEKYCRNKILLRLIKIDPEGNVALMVSELTKIAGLSSSDFVKQEKKPAGNSFRDEFAFLSHPDCPLELKALVTDKFSSYYSYRDLHKKLTQCTSAKECADVSRAIIDSYLENRAIYAELDYYRQHKHVLGKHPIFKHYNKIASLRKLSIKDLVLKQQQLEHNIWRIQSEISKNDKPHLEGERLRRLEEKKAELSEVNRIIQ